jgi:hypothetical protein
MNRTHKIAALAGTLPRRKIAPLVGMTPNHLSVYCHKHGISLKLKPENLNEMYRIQKIKGGKL